MSEFMTPPLLITEYYDSLISQLDIYTEEKSKEYKEKGLPVKLITKYTDTSFDSENEESVETYGVEMYNNPYKSQKYTINRTDISEKETTEKSQAEDYMNKMRQKAIDEIRKVQDENLKFYNANKEQFKVDRKNRTEEKLEELKSQLFASRFCFLLKREPIYVCEDLLDNKDIKSPLFNIHTVITDFYLRESDIDFIRSYINNVIKESNRWKIQNNSSINKTRSFPKYIRQLLDGDLNGYEVIEIKQNTLLKIEHINVMSKHHLLSIDETDLSFDVNIDFSAIKSLNLYIDKAKKEAKISDLSAFVNLEYLSIYYIKLSRWPFENLKKLIKLELHQCDLTEFDFDSLNSITSLQIIEMIANAFKNETDIQQEVLLKIDLTRLINLKWLDLKFYEDESPIKVELIADSYNQLTKLKVDEATIDFSKQLDLPALKCLEISNADLSKQINQQSFYGMPSLNELFLIDINLTNVDFLDTDRLGNLELLDLSYNQIAVLRKGAFSNLKKLKRLILKKNQIKELIPGVFEGLECLKDLDLTSNKINIGSINKTVFDGLKCLKYIHIRGHENSNVNVDYLKKDGLNVY